MSGPEPARWLVAPLVDNPTPNRREVEAAREIVRAFTQRHGLMLDDLAGMLALVRDGYTLEGPRVIVEAHASLERRQLERGAEALEVVTRGVWRRWIDELASKRLRPAGWPAVTRTFLAWTDTAPDAGPPHLGGLVEVDESDDRWVVLNLGLACEAVPATA